MNRSRGYQELPARGNIPFRDAPAPLKVDKSSARITEESSPTTARISKDSDILRREGTTPNDERRGSVSRKAIGSGLVTSKEKQLEAPSIIKNDRNYIVKDSAFPPSLEGIVDLSNTEDTTVHESWAPGMNLLAPVLAKASEAYLDSQLFSTKPSTERFTTFARSKSLGKSTYMTFITEYCPLSIFRSFLRDTLLKQKEAG